MKTQKLLIITFGAALCAANAQQSNTIPPGLPPGLEKRNELPPGLSKRDELPPGLAKRTNQFNTNAVAGGSSTNSLAGSSTNSLGSSTNSLAASSNAVGSGLSMTGRTNMFNYGTSNAISGSNLPPTGLTNSFNYGTSNRFGSNLPPTGRTEGFDSNQASASATSQASANVTVNVVASSAADQPIATQIREIIVAEPALAATLPQVNIRVQNGAVTLAGETTCPAEGVLIEKIIQQRIPNARVNNRIHVSTVSSPSRR